MDNDEDESVGCISWSRIPPPHTVNSLKRAICRAEQIADPTTYEIYKTFLDDEPLDEAQKLVLQSGQYPGVKPNEPVVLVNRKSGLDGMEDAPSSTSADPSLSARAVAPPSVLTDNPARMVVAGQEILPPSNAFFGHTACVNAVAISPDGSLIASASDDKTIRITQITSATLFSALEGHTESVISVAFSPDGTKVASGSSNKKLCVWETASGKSIQSLSDDYPVRCVCFSPDGSRLASSSINSEIRLWDPESAICLSPARDPGRTTYSSAHYQYLPSDVSTACISFSPNGSHVAAASEDMYLQVWEMTTMTRTVNLSGHTRGVHSVTWSSNGSLLASASADGTIKIWDIGTKLALATLQDRSDVIRSIAFSPDGSRLASTGELVTIFDVASGAIVSSIHLQGYFGVNCPVFWSNGVMLAVGSSDNTVLIWNIE